jgi:hypothetical protein
MDPVEKPLHVKVAEALGCKPVLSARYSQGYGRDIWLCDCLPDGKDHVDYEGHIPGLLAAYDTDWSATGPLIEQMRISIERPEDRCDNPAKHTCLKWNAFSPEYDRAPAEERERYNTAADAPLIAVCHLILALHEAGKLPK